MFYERRKRPIEMQNYYRSNSTIKMTNFAITKPVFEKFVPHRTITATAANSQTGHMNSTKCVEKKARQENGAFRCTAAAARFHFE